MVISKRCKVCSILSESNFPIDAEYYGNSLPEVIRKVAGLELQQKKINGVLICEHCAISIIQAASTVNKLQRALGKLGKNLFSEMVAISSTATDAFTKFKNQSLNDSASNKAPQIKIQSKKKKVQNQPKKSLEAISNIESVNNVSDLDKKSTEDLCELKTTEHESLNSIQNIKEAEVKSRKRKINVESPYKLVDSNHSINNSLNDISSIVDKVRNCILCNKMFTQKAELKEHIENDHNGEELKACPICSMSFTSLQKYEAHVSKAKCLKMSSFVCEYPECNKNFSSSDKLELHLQMKH